jgi:penicillin amidase
MHNKAVVALKWSALEPSTEIQAAFQFATARNWDEFKKALEEFHSPAQNFIFASTDGTIAYRANGKIPIRSKGNSLLPVPGWTGEYEWKGYIPWNELPTVVNPEKGFIATANNRVVGDSYPYHLSHVWAPPYRQMRIVEVLKQNKKFSVEDMKQLQYDHLNLQAREFNPLLTYVLKEHLSSLREIDKKGLSVLQSWNCVDDKKYAAPLIFHLTMNQIYDTLFAKELEPRLLEFFERKSSIVDQLLRNAHLGKPGPWIKEHGGLHNVLMTSYKKAMDRASSLQGNEPSKWSWGEYHQAIFPHPLSSVKPLHLLFNPKRVPLSGSSVTVDSEGHVPDTGEVDYGPAWRTVVDMANPLESLNVLTPGQSGHVMSKWYIDQIEHWANGEYHITSMKPEKYRDNSRKLLFKPQN